MIRTVLLSGAGLAIATSLVMQMSGRKHESLFFGQWVPTLVAVALWYQMIKGQQGQTSRARPPSDVIV
ncbi:MAG TPA: hypothetical protein VGN11_08635 [Candidatus Baltobacteraceae bacterium]|nr:hypothetical protein [Candidatus Baltobacteraceae bacterium]